MTTPDPDPTARSTSPLIDLNDGSAMPQLGLGLMRFGDEDATRDVLRRGFDLGYRLFDTAAVYGTESQTGAGTRGLDVRRDEYFVTTKLWNSAHGRAEARAACEQSVERLGIGPIDLYLVHWPVPEHDRYVETWQTLIELRDEGRIRSIGVSNFTEHHLGRLIDETGVVPSVNQVELHPYFQQRPLRQFHDAHGIVTQAWSPFGGGGRGRTGALLDDPVITAIAARHACQPTQVVLAWHLTNAMSVIPKATSSEHLAQNLASIEVDLGADDLDALAGLDRDDGRIGPHPDQMNVRQIG